MPQVSMLRPFRNAEDMIDECIDSVRRRSTDDFEVLAIDDRSSDRTADIIRDHRKVDPRVRLRASPKPRINRASSRR